MYSQKLSQKPIAGSIAVTIKQPSVKNSDRQKNLTEDKIIDNAGENSDTHINKEACILITSPATGKVSASGHSDRRHLRFFGGLHVFSDFTIVSVAADRGDVVLTASGFGHAPQERFAQSKR